MKQSCLVLVIGFIVLSFIVHSCKKKEELPTLSTSTITNITATTASGGGNITSDGGAEVTARGVCWGANENPTITDSKTSNASGTGQFVSEITGLTAGTAYHVRAYATNSVGTAYGADLTFTTLGQAPDAITHAATNILPTGATLNGTVNANDLSTTVTFEYGLTTDYGQTTNASQSPVTGSSILAVSSEITGLTEGKIYHFRIKTVNSLGTTYGNDMSFTTLGQKPTATTLAACCIRNNGATLNGSVTANYVSTTVTFEYGLTTAYGSSVTAIPSPVTGNNSTSISASISGLNAGTSYHFRVKAVNSLGTIYGGDMEFTTLATVIDVDGNTYNFVVIGTQTWMKENLATTKYNDGTLIPYTPDALAWSGMRTPAFCYHINDPEVSYGAYYNWYAVDAASNGGKNICPTGWHVPSNPEWNILDTFLGGYSVAGPKLMETGTAHWPSPNSEATNSSGFTALPGGYRNGSEGNFYGFGTSGSWFTSTSFSIDAAHIRDLYAGGGYQSHTYSKNTGYSIRCIKDN